MTIHEFLLTIETEEADKLIMISDGRNVEIFAKYLNELLDKYNANSDPELIQHIKKLFLLETLKIDEEIDYYNRFIAAFGK